MAIEQIFTWFMTSGAYNALLPFFLIFTLVFGFLQKSKVFGENSKKFNVVLGLIIGLMVVIPHVTNSYPAGADPIQIMLDALPNVALWLVAIFALWLVMAALGLPVTFEGKDDGIKGFLTILSVAVVFVIFGYAAGWFPPNWGLVQWLNSIDGGVLQIILILAIVVGLLVWLLSEDEVKKSDGSGFWSSFGKGLENIGKDNKR